MQLIELPDRVMPVEIARGIVAELEATLQSDPHRVFSKMSMDAIAAVHEEAPEFYSRFYAEAKPHVDGNLWRSAVSEAKKRRAALIFHQEAKAEDHVMFEIGDHAEIARHYYEKDTREGARPVYDHGAYHMYSPDSGLWQPHQDYEIRRRVQDLNGFIGKDDDAKRVHLSRGTQVGVAETLFDRATVPGFFDKAPEAVAFSDRTIVARRERDGTITLEETEHSPDYRCRIGYDFTLGEARACPTPQWSRYLEGSFNGDVEVIRVIQQSMGAAILGIASRYAKAIFLIGAPGTGKSTMLESVTMAMPFGGVAHVRPQDLGDDNKVAQLATARLNAVYEMPRDPILNPDRLKEVIDGAGMTVREAYGRAFRFEPRCAHFFAANRLPPVPGAAQDFFDRWIVVPMMNRIRGTDAEIRKLSELMVRERPGIVWWALEGARDLVRSKGYAPCAIATQALQGWLGEADSVTMWLAEQREHHSCTFEHNTISYALARDTYKSFAQWCKDLGYGRLGEREFMARLDALNIQRKRSSRGYHLPCILIDEPF